MRHLRKKLERCLTCAQVDGTAPHIGSSSQGVSWRMSKVAPRIGFPYPGTPPSSAGSRQAHSFAAVQITRSIGFNVGNRTRQPNWRVLWSSTRTSRLRLIVNA